MGKGYLTDTNVVIDYLENKLPEKATSFIDDLEMQVSIISRIELFAWKNITPIQHFQLSGFLAVSQVLNLTEEVVQQTIEIRKTYSIKLPDAIIAATSLSHNLTLITRNTADFEKIEKLEVFNPWAIS